MSSFFQGKGDASKKPVGGSEEVRAMPAPAVTAKPASDVISTLGRGMVVTGNIVCDGSVQVHGRVIGDIHVAQLVVCEGAQVEGNVTAQDVAIHGAFKGTIRGNSVKLHGKAVIDGEIFNRSLKIEENVQFEGVSRRLDKPVEVPTAAQLNGDKPALVPAQHAEPIAGAVV